jgi:hypothetical protein
MTPKQEDVKVKTVEALVAEVTRKHALAVEELTESQFVTALKQAIECGDFIRQVRATDSAQNIIYVPYAREQELESKYRELESLVTAYMVAPEASEHCKNCYDNLREWWERRSSPKPLNP